MIRRCPDCGAGLEAKIRRAPVIEPNVYMEAWSCPNFANHGTTVECSNCGEQVRNSQEHYTYTPGLIGSGRWVCYPSEAFRQKMHDQLAQDWDERLARRREVVDGSA